MDYAKTHSIRALFNPYTKNDQIWICPSDSSSSKDYKISSWYTSYPYRFYMFYTFSGAAGGDQANRLYTLQSFKAPSNTWIFNDALPYHDMRAQANIPAGYSGCCWVADAKENFVFLDGHAKTLSIDKALPHGTWPFAPFISYDKNWPRLGWDNGWPNPDTD